MRAGGCAQQVESGVESLAPLDQCLVNSILQTSLAGGDGNDLCSHQLHALDIGVLAGYIVCAHVNLALKSQQCCGHRGGRAVLACTRLSDEAGFSHALSQQCLADHVITLVRATVVQVFALEHNRRVRRG